MKLAPAFVALLLSWPLSAVAQNSGTLTLAEGPLRLIRGTTVLRGTEGVRLRSGDMLETADKGFAQIELADGRILAVGGTSRLLIQAYGSGAASPMVLLAGWLKVETPASSTTYIYASPRLAVSTKGSTILLQAAPDAAEAFFESGSGIVSPVNAQGSQGSPLPAKLGQFFSRRPGKGILSGSRPDSTFISLMPVPFRDTLPPRLSHFATKAVEPKADHEVTYSDVEPWLRMNTVWRRGFVERFRPRLRDKEFRKQLEAHLNNHPEWGPILHPEKEDKPPTTPAAAESTSPRGR